MRAYFLAFAALIVVAVVIPFEFGQSRGINLNAALPITFFICGIWLLQILILRRPSDLEASRIVIAVVSFLAIALVAFVAGQFPWFSSPGAPLPAQIASLGLMLLSGGLFLSIGHQIRHVCYLRWLTWIFMLSGALFLFTEILPVLGFASRWTGANSVGSMFWIWLSAMSISQAIFNLDLSRTVRISLFCLTALTLYRGLFLAASWVSGWLPPLVAIGVILLFRIPRTIIGLGLLSLPACLILAAQAYKFLMINEQYSWLSRLEALRVLWQLFEKSPLIGLGPANYHYYTLLYPIWGWYVRFNSHNNYIDILLQTGILGLMAFSWFLIEIIRMCLKLLGSRSLPDFARAYLIGVLGGLCAALISGMLADWIIPFYYNIGLPGFRSSLLFWLFLGGALALKRIAATQHHSFSVKSA